MLFQRDGFKQSWLTGKEFECEQREASKHDKRIDTKCAVLCMGMKTFDGRVVIELGHNSL